MIYYYLNIIYLMMLSFVIFFLSLYFLVNKLVIFMEMEFIKISSVKIEYLILLDWVSLIFISVVMIISSMVIFYSMEYMEDDKFIDRFMFMINLFVLSMILMIVSPNLISILMGWDGLGLISFCLVVFYQNEKSYVSGMVTVLMNRVGDIIILMLIGFVMSLGSWNFMFLFNLNNFLLVMIIIISFTKSAQIPFSPWLPMAMAAPTPVSSLVHSSTLVTAGVYLLIRFSYLMYNNVNLMIFLKLISIYTMLMAGISANLENDFKKIIAFSTLSQLGVMIFCLSMKLPEISFFHLLTHSMFKSMLFMCAGVIIHNFQNNQDIRCISFISFNYPVLSMLFSCSNLSLCGMPFLSGFFSKDLILEMYMMNSMMNFMIFLMLFISMGLTVMYSFRLIFFSFIKSPKFIYFVDFLSYKSKMMHSMLFMYIMSVIMGSLLNWLMFSSLNVIFLPKILKFMIYLFMLMGMVLGFFIYKININESKLINLNFLIKFNSNLWFLMFLYSSKLLNFFKFSKKLVVLDLGWNEYLMGLNIKKYMMKLFEMDLLYNNFIYLLIFIIYLMLFMLII